MPVYLFKMFPPLCYTSHVLNTIFSHAGKILPAFLGSVYHSFHTVLESMSLSLKGWCNFCSLACWWVKRFLQSKNTPCWSEAPLFFWWLQYFLSILSKEVNTANFWTLACLTFCMSPPPINCTYIVLFCLSLLFPHCIPVLAWCPSLHWMHDCTLSWFPQSISPLSVWFSWQWILTPYLFKGTPVFFLHQAVPQLDSSSGHTVGKKICWERWPVLEQVTRPQWLPVVWMPCEGLDTTSWWGSGDYQDLNSLPKLSGLERSQIIDF